MPVEDAFQVRHQLAQVGTEAGRKNDRVEFSAFPIGEHDAIGREAVNAAAYFDRAVPDFVQRADIDQGYAPVLFDHLPWALGGAAQSQFFDSTDREPQDRRVDRIDQTRGQAPVQNGPRQDRKAQEIARQNLNRAANRKRDIDAGSRQIQRDLTARIAESDDHHALPRVGRGIAIFAAVDDQSLINFRARPRRTIGRVGYPRCNDHNGRVDRAPGCLRAPLRPVAPDARHRRIEDWPDIKAYGIAFEILD